MDKDKRAATDLALLDNQENAEQLLQQHQQRLSELPGNAEALERAGIELEIAETLLALERRPEAFITARRCLNTFIDHSAWQQATESCDVMFQADQPDSVIALGHGVWLAVTYPVEPTTSVAMLNHIVDETPNDSDGAAVAAIAAQYIVDMRASDTQHESLSFLTMQIIAKVAKRHSNVESQEQMDFWRERLELNDPQLFLPRLSQIVNVMVGDKWWFDREELRARLPIH
ncbi:MAG: hypothetical protein R6X06_06235 [Gammaproteobacteria bacterium]